MGIKPTTRRLQGDGGPGLVNGALGPRPLELVNILTYAAPNDDPFLVANLPHPVGPRNGLGNSPIHITVNQ